MDDIVDHLVRLAARCERAASLLDDDPVKTAAARITDACKVVAQAWSGSWIGYHAHVYTHGFEPRKLEERFGTRSNEASYLQEASGIWAEYSFEAVRDGILARAGGADLGSLTEAAKAAGDVFDECRRDLLQVLTAVIEQHADPTLRDLLAKGRALRSHVSRSAFAQASMPRGQLRARDTRAFQGHLQTPHHVAVETLVMEALSHGHQLHKLAQVARHAATRLR